MIVKAYLTAFHREGEVKIRPIDIPEDRAAGQDNDGLLSLAFELGQNMFQAVPGCYSVSVGDVIELPDGSCHRVMGAGFAELEAGVDPVALLGTDASDATRAL